jgi:inward rectifier potassium channel
MIESPKSSMPRRMRVANRELLTVGLRSSFWSDIHHRAMTMSWPAFVGSAATLFIAFNAGFALLYLAGNDPVANAPRGNFAYLFYFSIETLATVGYGDMHPQTHWGHLVATLEIFTGMSFLALYTGLMFARFSRPQARFIFARSAVVDMESGQATLMIRVANERQNTISNATARLWLVRSERNADGSERRRFLELKLLRSENPVFAFSWTLFHPIAGDSPLCGMTNDGLIAAEASLVLTLSGLDEASGQILHARNSYAADAILWNHRYVDMMKRTSAGQIILDYSRLDEVIAA